MRRAEVSMPWTTSPEPMTEPRPPSRDPSNTARERSYLSWLSSTPLSQLPPFPPLRVTTPSEHRDNDREANHASSFASTGVAAASGARPSAPRLRRGGIRAPENLARHASHFEGWGGRPSGDDERAWQLALDMSVNDVSGGEELFHEPENAESEQEHAQEYERDASPYPVSVAFSLRDSSPCADGSFRLKASALSALRPTSGLDRVATYLYFKSFVLYADGTITWLALDFPFVALDMKTVLILLC
ncbi:hypothetical protein EW146_g10463 [Bondarzewia mesenterica]|uniref:Uncharacterized protein n=1 Tax=Bondarzewia mesenterica TaxID=1095465 RepID=A0A4S4KX41_9AGAM|nr:hypothetical protein EW146_g10463 [Bondarzewia mesenterica]